MSGRVYVIRYLTATYLSFVYLPCRPLLDSSYSLFIFRRSVWVVGGIDAEPFPFLTIPNSCKSFSVCTLVQVNGARSVVPLDMDAQHAEEFAQILGFETLATCFFEFLNVI